MKEQSVLLGITKDLLGVVIKPRKISYAKNRPAIILPAKLLHRVGPNRFYQKLTISFE